MAHSLSAKKRVRQSAKLRLKNRDRKRTVRTEIKKIEGVIAGGDKAAAVTELKAAQKTIDKIASKGTLHKKTAARRKSRLAKKVNALQAK